MPGVTPGPRDPSRPSPCVGTPAKHATRKRWGNQTGGREGGRGERPVTPTPPPGTRHLTRGGCGPRNLGLPAGCHSRPPASAKGRYTTLGAEPSPLAARPRPGTTGRRPRSPPTTRGLAQTDTRQSSPWKSQSRSVSETVCFCGERQSCPCRSAVFLRVLFPSLREQNTGVIDR